MKAIMLTLSMLAAALPTLAQHPDIFDISDVVVGSQKLDTTWAYAVGKWSDSGDGSGTHSTQIHCYKRFAFCEVASAYSLAGKAMLNLDSFDILRWDRQELIAVDSSPICVVNTLRFDFAAKQVTLSSTSKGMEAKDKFCKGMDKLPTAFLTGTQDEIKRIDAQSKQKKK